MATKKLTKSESGAQAEIQAPTMSPLYVNSVEKALRVLRAFDGSRPTMTLTQIAEASQLDFSAVQRFTFTLTQLGLLYKDPETRLYGLTPRTLEFGYRYLRSNMLVERASPYLLQLSNDCKETVNLNVLDGLDIIILSRILCRQIVNVDAIVGARYPAFCTAAGLAILSALPRAEALELVAASDLRKFTKHTINTTDQIIAEIERTAGRGYGLTCEQIYIGDISLAAPILGFDGRPVGALNISVPTSRWNVNDLEATFSQQVVAAANAVSLKRDVN